MSGAKRTKNLQELPIEKLYDSKNNLSQKLDEIKYDIDKMKQDIIKQKEELDCLIKTKKTKNRALRRVMTEIQRRRNGLDENS